MNRWLPALQLALQEAELASAHGDVPIGAVVLSPTGEVIARAHNERELTGDPTAHAEVVALRRAAFALQAAASRDAGAEEADLEGSWRLDGCTLVVTLEPCTMCAGALVLARVDRVVFGAYDPKAGAIASLWDVVRDPRLNHQVEVVGGIAEEECGALIRDFFAGQR
ncbi:MAG: nucleoside deaminase [Micropruina sp.]|nr:nucleoside deaminase [Micropruina sp.]